MEERVAWQIQSGLEVYDKDGGKIGTVAHLHEPESASPPGTAGDGGGGYLEVTTGLLSRLGLAKPLYVPLVAVRDVTEGGVFLSATKAEVEQADWHTRPDAMAGGAETYVAPASEVASPLSDASSAPEVASPPSDAPPAPEVVSPPSDAPSDASSAPQAVAALEDWSTAASYYRRRWEAQPGAPGERWVTYEPRYRFAWEMARLPGYAGEPWPRVRPELRARWEVQHPDVEWDTVADSVRDAWEHVAGAVAVPGR